MGGEGLAPGKGGESAREDDEDEDGGGGTSERAEFAARRLSVRRHPSTSLQLPAHVPTYFP